MKRRSLTLSRIDLRIWIVVSPLCSTCHRESILNGSFVVIQTDQRNWTAHRALFDADDFARRIYPLLVEKNHSKHDYAVWSDAVGRRRSGLNALRWVEVDSQTMRNVPYSTRDCYCSNLGHFVKMVLFKRDTQWDGKRTWHVNHAQAKGKWTSAFILSWNALSSCQQLRLISEE